jgi:hypothetical protein
MSAEPNPPSPPPPPGPPPGGPPRSAQSIDFAAVPRSVWVSLGGAVVLLISVFMNWYSIDLGPLGSVGIKATDATDLAWLVFLCAAAAIAVWAIELFVPTVELPAPAWQIAGAAGALAALIVVVRMIDQPGGELVSLSFGIFLALIAAVAVVAGAYLNMQERR